MDKQDYINTLKDLNLRPNKVKIKEREETVLMESKEEKRPQLLNEIFIEMGEVESMAPGPRKDMAILRLAIIAEYDATSLYEKMAQQTSDNHIKEVLLDIANEEKQHIGEFEFLLEHIDPEHEKNENEGEDEAKELTGLGDPPFEED